MSCQFLTRRRVGETCNEARQWDENKQAFAWSGDAFTAVKSDHLFVLPCRLGRRYSFVRLRATCEFARIRCRGK